ncbi:hypothetical protein ACJJTC_018516 [Scirpophaga incertulas]
MDSVEIIPTGPCLTIGGVPTWTLGDTIAGISFVLVLYLVTVLVIIPNYMKRLQPLKLKNTLLIYNAFQVVFSTYIVYVYVRYLLTNGLFIKKCVQGEELEKVASEIIPYFIAKHLDLLDTVFIVLRKKDKQITFLHLLHHTCMIAWTWLHLMYYPTDHFVFVGILNSFVHVQFILVVWHLYYQQKWSPCPIPAFFHYFCLSSIISFFLLFLKFYISNYKSRKTGIYKSDINIDIQIENEKSS